MARGRNKRREHGQGDKLKYTCMGCWIKNIYCYCYASGR
jgi:hypothetical protein